MKILFLPLKEHPFKTMEAGLKDREYRTPSKWMKSRLIDKQGNQKHYDVIKFTWGYGSERPYFVASFLGFEIAQKNYSVSYSTGLKVDVKKGDFRIKLGAIVKRGNIYSKEIIFNHK